jgi:hypothetical protein
LRLSSAIKNVYVGIKELAKFKQERLEANSAKVISLLKVGTARSLMSHLMGAEELD